jgi:hypothetical protein
MNYIKIDNDNWDDINTVWRVLEYVRREHTTGVSLVLEDAYTKKVVHRVVPSHQIIELEAKDW